MNGKGSIQRAELQHFIARPLEILVARDGTDDAAVGQSRSVKIFTVLETYEREKTSSGRVVVASRCAPRRVNGNL